MSVTSVWVGRTTESSARVKTKVTGTSVRIAVDTDEALNSPTFHGPVSPTSEGVATVDVTGLQSNTQYYYAVEEDSAIDTNFPGNFTTFPPSGEVSSFTFIAAGDAGLSPDFPGVGSVVESNRMSNAATFDTIRNRDPLFFIHLGDIHYYNPGGPVLGIIGNDLDDYRRCLDDVLLQPRQHQLYREVPLVYTWDDHDYGPNNSNGGNPGKFNAGQVYREKVPSYDLPDQNGAIYHTFQVGRVQFVMLDTRFYKDDQGAPDDENKSMLGMGQKEWLRDLLETSESELMFIISSVQWIRGSLGGEAWGSYSTERDEISAMLQDNGWADRVVFLSADAHSLGLDSGANNQWPPGAPAFALASIDATPSSMPADAFDIGVSNAREQYGEFVITDQDSQITVEAFGFQGNSALFTLQFAVTEVGPEPGPDPVPTEPVLPVARAKILQRVAWLACDLASGGIITDLPGIEGDQVRRLIGEHTTSNFDLPIASVGDPSFNPSQRASLALRATRPARTMIVAAINDIPAWAGIPLPRDTGTNTRIPIGCVSLEGYLQHRFVTSHTFVDVDLAVIIRALLDDAESKDGMGQGMNLVQDVPALGVNESREYVDGDDQSIYSALRELQSSGLIEWTIDVDWREGFEGRIVDKIARVRPQLGNPDEVQAVFSRVVSYRDQQDYENGEFANWVRYRGRGEGEDQPRSDPAIDTTALEAGDPIWESRKSAPGTNITDVNDLNQHATTELSRVRDGGSNLVLRTPWDAYPRYGVDWQIGDLVRYELKGEAHPGGLVGSRRAVGFTLRFGQGVITPILQET